MMHDFIGLNLDICSLALGATQGLVNHYPAVWQAVSLPLLTRGEQEGAHGCGKADTYSRHIWANVTHGVEHSHPSSDRTTRGVNVYGDILLGIRRVKPKELCDNQIAAVVVDSTTKPDYPLIHELARDALETLHDDRIRALALLRNKLMPGNTNW